MDKLDTQTRDRALDVLIESELRSNSYISPQLAFNLVKQLERKLLYSVAAASDLTLKHPKDVLSFALG